MQQLKVPTYFDTVHFSMKKLTLLASAIDIASHSIKSMIQ